MKINLTESEILTIAEALRVAPCAVNYDDGWLKLFRRLGEKFAPLAYDTRIERGRRRRMRASVRVVRVMVPVKERPLSATQLRMLRGAADGEPYRGIHGQSAHGGAYGTKCSLIRRGLLTEDMQVTFAGRTALLRIR
jgi:hypothetical protein